MIFDIVNSQSSQEGFKVIHFWNNDVMGNLEGVLEMIIETPHPPLCCDLSHKGESKKYSSPTS
jgi:hypothetical protein